MGLAIEWATSSVAEYVGIQLAAFLSMLLVKEIISGPPSQL